MGNAAEETQAKPASGSKPRRYRGRMPEERQAQRRRKLLDTGLELFATTGYASTSVERICSAAGVTGRHFYEEFSSREALLMGVYDEIMHGSFERVTTDVAAAPVELKARLDAGVAAYMHHLLDDPRHARIVIVESVGVSSEFEAHRRRAVAAFADFISGEARALEAEGTTIQGNELTIFALVAALHELTTSWLAMHQPVSIDALVTEGVRIVMAVALVASVERGTEPFRPN